MLRNFLPIRSYLRKAGNPGLNKLTRNLQNADDIVDDPEGFGDIESDFLDVHRSHKEHERELKQRQHQIKHFIVGRKYFNETQPNFLTYAEKQQIKLLHDRDSQEWTAEKLSESFPATPEIIAKIIKAKWIAATPRRVEQHDKTVARNWKLFGEGKCNELDASLEQHLRKFTNRTEKDLKSLATTTVLPRPELPRPKRTEFLSIITESMKFRKSAENSQDVQQITDGSSEKTVETTRNSAPPPISSRQSMEDESYLLATVQNRKPMRFRDLIKANPEMEQDRRQVAMHQVENPQGTGVVDYGSAPGRKNELQGSKFEANEVEMSARDMISLSDRVRERIHIPRRLWRKGRTYKFKDCYYDDDGELLYRVPGMTGTFVK